MKKQNPNPNPVLRWLKKNAITLAVAGSVLLVGTTAKADISTAMTNQFNSMTTTTPPTVNISATQRGVISGGGIAIKNRISSVNLINFVPPSWEAGCGGIDLFAGSFDFINMEQFTQLLRNVASNALGYSFQLALGALCQSCLENLKNLQKSIQSINENMKDSCELAKGFLDSSGISGGIEAALRKDENDAAGRNEAEGVGSWFTGLFNVDGAGKPSGDAVTAGHADECTVESNILWCELARQGATGWFDAGTGDNQMMETVMSFTGTVIVGAETAADDGKGTQPEINIVDPTMSLKDMVTGGDNVTMLQCLDANCLDPDPVLIDFKGLEVIIEEYLLGDGVNQGIVDKLANNGPSLTTAQWHLLTNMPHNMGYMIRNLSAKSRSLAVSFVDKTSKIIAREIAYNMVYELMDTASAVKSASKSAMIDKFIDLLRSAEQRLRDENQQITTETGDMVSVITFYNALIAQAQRRRYEESLNPNNRPAIDKNN